MLAEPLSPAELLLRPPFLGVRQLAAALAVVTLRGLRNSARMSLLSMGKRLMMPKIDIDSLSEKELIELNHKIVARLRFLNQMRSHAEMLDFRIGEKVRLRPSGRAELVGTVTRYNKKTVTVITEDGQHWNVSPSFLSKADSKSERNVGSEDAGVVRFPNRSAGE